MTGIPAELLFAVFFAAVLFAQHLMRRSGERPQPGDAPQDAPQDAPVAQTQPAEQPVSARPRRASGTDVAAVSLAGAGRAAPRAMAAASSAGQPRQRSASISPLGGRRGLQRAIVNITLLGPCRAEEPHTTR